MDISKERINYEKGELLIENCPANPFQLFKTWVDEAVSDKLTDATAFHLASIGEDGFPHNRVVLLKYLDENRGLTFFTNYDSQKGQNIDSNPKVSMNFFWKEHERQIRVLGIAEKCSDELSDEYFYSRPRGSQIGAIISNQSQELVKREDILAKYHELENKEDLKRPVNWGGYNIKPLSYEFWQGGAFRSHHRVAYKMQGESWGKVLLQP